MDSFELADALLQSIQRRTEAKTTDSSYAEAIKLQAILANVDLKLRYIVNTSRPGGIGRLPNSALTKIFRILVDLPIDSAKDLFPSRSLRWIATTHVCTNWRKIALSTPSLWTHILLHATGGATSLIDTFITRSGDLPLTITLGRGARNVTSIPRIQAYRQGLRRIVNSVSHRIASLVVEPGFPIDDVLRADRLGQKLTEMLSQAVPARTVSLKSANSGSPSSESEDSLSTLFHSAGAQLQHLELCGDPVISHTLGAGASLQHLNVLCLLQTNPNSPTPKPPALSALLKLLSNLKSTLRRLTLVGIQFSDDTTDSSAVQQAVHLDSLEYLELGDWRSNGRVAAFLSRLHPPRVAAQCVWGKDLDEMSSSAIYPFLHRHLGDTRCVVLGSVPGGNMIGIRDGVLFINGAIPFFVYCSLFTKPLASAHKLVFTPLINPLTIAEWCRLFELLPNIRNLEVRDADPGRLLRALRLKPGLPHLTELDLQFSDVPSSETELNPLGIRYSTEPPSLAALLYSVASQRHSESSRGVDPLVRRFERIYVRFDSRAKAVDDWEPELDAIFDRMREHVGRVLYFKRKWRLPVSRAAAEETERKNEMDDRWYLAMGVFEGMWPTKAAYLSHLAGLIKKDE